MSRKVTLSKIILSVILTIIFLIIILKLTVVNTSKENVNSEKPITEITLVTSWGGMDTHSFQLEKIISDFESKYKDIKIINKSRENDNFLFALKTDFAQGNDPDVFGLWPGTDIVKLINADKVVDLTDVLSKDKTWKNSFGENGLKYNIYDNKIYGLPVEVIYEGLFVNKDIFDSYKIKIPETYEELKTAVKKLKENGIIPIAYNSSPEGSYLYQNIIMKLGGEESVKNPFKGDKIDSVYIDAMKYMKELYDLGAFPTNAFLLDDKGRNNLFLNKKAAMIVQGSWFIGEGAVSANDRSVDLVPFPNFKDGKAAKKSIIYGIGNGNFHISKKAFDDSQKREASIKFLKYLTSIDVVKQLRDSSGSICNIKGLERGENGTLIMKGYSLVDNAEQLIGPPDSYFERTPWENVVVNKFPNVLEGKITPEEVFDKKNMELCK
ncbi:ABC transporter substrate-binding protein [Inconstantimicrobium mannanitabidum]|uniref:ABC transporter substrate-binding protein n=1 Tax=Inconstantimicrobium mannanitabidum TaxID=1604901 RepID=A0ACB5RD86_9CLOT|nr:extracellular solute-binding protein [Clostridium sp. TW13]GKX67237.1 ABC transporter substrate-binding protein [Clostridium sp. TW13]